MFTVQLFNPEKHYQIILDWWSSHNWDGIPLEALPKANEEQYYGYVCYYDDKPVCSGFVYGSCSNIAWLEWLLCDKNASKEYRSEAIDFLIEKLEDMAKNILGARTLFTSVISKPLIRRLGKHKFQVTDKNMTNLIKVL